jgi:hypothetical protein
VCAEIRIRLWNARRVLAVILAMVAPATAAFV